LPGGAIKLPLAVAPISMPTESTRLKLLKGGVTGIYRSSYIRKESHNMYFILNI
jgi:hypothetical protein